MNARSAAAGIGTLRKVVVTAAVAMAFVAGIGGVAQAAPGRVATPTSPAASPATFGQLSCFGRSFCDAIGSYSKPGHPFIPLIELWNGKVWRVIPDPVNFNDVITCGGLTFCLAAASPQGHLRSVVWNGRAWKVLRPQPPDVFDVTCTSPTFCVTLNSSVDPGGYVAWNGKSWQPMADNAGECGGPDCHWDSLTCVSSKFCQASGTFCTDDNCDSEMSFDSTWTGTEWIQPPGGPTYSGSQACTGPAFCLNIGLPVVDVAPRAEVSYDWEAIWHDASANLAATCNRIKHCITPRVMACGSSRSCLLIPAASSSVSVSWNGTAWKTTRLALVNRRRPNLSLLSCGSTANCVAVGSYQPGPGRRPVPVAEHWNGSSWKFILMPNP